MKKITFLVILGTMNCFSKFTLSPLFGDDMVLQRNVPAKIWGKSAPNEVISIIFKSKKYSFTTSMDSTWKIDIGTHEAGGPYDMLIQSSDNSQVYFENIKFGDVWLCGGQSNMEFTLDALSTPISVIKQIKNDIVSMLTLDKISSSKPQKDILSKEGWLETNPKNVGRFSATAFYFADTLSKTLKIPVGLISNNWGGSPVEVWMSNKSLEAFPQISEAYSQKNFQDSIIIKGIKTRKLMLSSWVEQSISKDSISMLYKDKIEQIEYKNWTKTTLPLNFDNIKLNDYNGILWAISEFELTENMKNKPLNLSLGLIDDADHTFINGQKVGGKFLYNEPRNYKIAPSVFKVGKNILAIRVVNYGGNGNITPQGKSFFMTNETGDSLNLSNTLYVCKGYDLTKIPEYVKPNWRYEAGWQPSTLYNGMIAPMLDLPIKGVIWYQGESNTDRAYQYRALFSGLINDWRKSFKQPNLPFLFVQLANFQKPDSVPSNSTWAELREAQSYALKLPFTAMSTAIDIGDEVDIHPKDKKTVGNRLAAQAQRLVYGKKIISDGPTYQSMKILGNKIVLSFTNTGSGMMTKNGLPQEFAIAGANKKFYRADAKIVNNTIVVSCNKVSKPVAVRYAWANNPAKINTYNKEGFPMNPFRTDNWKGTTFGAWKLD